MRKFITILLILFSLLIGDVSAYALTPAQKRAKEKERTELKRAKVKAKVAQKRANAKRKAERKKAAKAKAAKRKRIKDGKPLLYVYSYDLKTGDPLPATHITVQDVKAKPNKRPKVSKATDTKRSRVMRGLPVGTYWAVAAKTGYFTSDTIRFTHREDEDTIKLAIYPETRLTFNVIDSLTSRPVAANVIVRNNVHQKIMQTTSDSLHHTLAVLLDDRVPFYTVEATAINYFPFCDTIIDPSQFEGVIMSPKQITSFVLHNIYFATGNTRILDSSEPALNDLYQFLIARPDQRIRIVGHTDDIGSDRSNQLLSEGRCHEVKQNMVSRGIHPDRIEIEGRGERDPIVLNDTEEHRQMNRRVEIVLR